MMTDVAPSAPTTPPVPTTLTYEGQSYTVPPLAIGTDQLLKELAEHLRSQRVHPMQVLAEATEKVKAIGRADLIPGLTDAALRQLAEHHQPPTPEVLQQFLVTFDGLAWLLWRQLHQTYPDITVDQAKEMTLANAIRLKTAAASKE